MHKINAFLLTRVYGINAETFIYIYTCIYIYDSSHYAFVLRACKDTLMLGLTACIFTHMHRFIGATHMHHATPPHHQNHTHTHTHTHAHTHRNA